MIRPLVAACALALVGDAARAQTALPLSISPPARPTPPAEGDKPLPPAPPTNCNSRSLDGCQLGAGLLGRRQSPVGENAGAPTTGNQPNDTLPHGGMSPYGKPLPKTPPEAPARAGRSK